MNETSQNSRLYGFIVLSLIFIAICFLPFWALSGFKKTSSWSSILRYGWIIFMVIAVMLANRSVYGDDK